jgi:hypothetical protein
LLVVVVAVALVPVVDTFAIAVDIAPDNIFLHERLVSLLALLLLLAAASAAASVAESVFVLLLILVLILIEDIISNDSFGGQSFFLFCFELFQSQSNVTKKNVDELFFPFSFFL